MNNLIAMLPISVENKPKFGESCNSCGYCCLTEVCSVGKETGGGEFGPCKLLIKDENNENKLLCKLMLDENSPFREIIGTGTGCDAKTQQEMIEDFMN